jgi:hypothetical protein
MPAKAPLPRPGKRCGRREREAGTGSGGAILSRARGRGGGKHLISGKSAAFAGRRRNEGLGRSELASSRSLPRRAGAPATVGALRDAEEGNVVGSQPTKREHPTRGSTRHLTPRGHVLHSVRRPVHVDPGYAPSGQPGGGQADGLASRSGKPAQAGGTGTGAGPSGRRAARRASPLSQGSSRDASKKRKVVAATVPARTRGSWSKCPHVVCSCRSR